jgi:hypothetical protein
MKRIFLVVLAIIGMLTAIGGVLSRNRGVQAVSVQVNVKDIPKYGLTLISPSDPSFNDMASALLKGNQNAMFEALKPFSALLKNTGDLAVVGYNLKWEMMGADGTIAARDAGWANPGALMDRGAPGMEYLSTSAGFAIKPHSARLISFAFSVGEDEWGGSIGAYAGGSADPASIDPSKTAKLQQAARDKDWRPFIDMMKAELQSYTSITISIDGVFFEDGTFVGPDTTQYFARIKANIDAKRDLLQEIAFAMEHKRTYDEIFGDMEELANSPKNIERADASPGEYYEYYKKIYADEVVRMRRAMGNEKAIAMSLQPLRRQWPVLKKK